LHLAAWDPISHGRTVIADYWPNLRFRQR